MTDVIYTEVDSVIVEETHDASTIITTADTPSTVVCSNDAEASVVVTEGSTTIVETQDAEAQVIVSLEVGPPGPQGEKGNPGVDAVGAIPGILTGDFLRWNEEENKWEVKSEPIEFNQIVLTPAVAAILDKEGGLWYDSVNKSVMVCTSDH